jgi:hypothetical protein
MNHELKKDHVAKRQLVELILRYADRPPNQCQARNAKDKHCQEARADFPKRVDIFLKEGRELVTTFKNNLFLRAHLVQAGASQRQHVIGDI